MSMDIVCCEKNEEGTLKLLPPVDPLTAHQQGITHPTVILIPVQKSEEKQPPKIFIHQRAKNRLVSPGKFDFCGGHLIYDENLKQRDSYDWDTAFLETAIKEANEEIKCTPVLRFTKQMLYQFCDYGYFDYQSSGNNEYSTVYVVSIPKGIRQVVIRDDVEDSEHGLDSRTNSLDKLLVEYLEDKEKFADGAGRVLEKISKDDVLKSELISLIRKASI